MDMPINVVIADDDRITRSALRMVLNELRHVVVGEAADGERALEAVRHLKPDVVFMDIEMPGMDGLEAARRLQQSSPATQVIMVSAHVTVDNLQDSVRAGAGGFVVKPFNAAKVRHAIEQCRRGFR